MGECCSAERHEQSHKVGEEQELISPHLHVVTVVLCMFPAVLHGEKSVNSTVSGTVRDTSMVYALSKHILFQLFYLSDKVVDGSINCSIYQHQNGQRVPYMISSAWGTPSWQSWL